MADDTLFPQPQDIPWQPLCVSQDMMDATKCNKKIPFPWRSSIAVSAYEPKPEELPQPLCSGRITYLKITVSITGYQPTDKEINNGYTEFGNSPVYANLDNIFATYFGCYGALLNIAVYPNSQQPFWHLNNYPKIIGMEPQLRELVQSATESGELLTANKSGVSTAHSFTTVNNTKTGVSANAKRNASVKVPEIGEIGSTNELGLTHEWGRNITDKNDVTANASQDRSEKQSTSTQIQQMYNILSGYHQGTNRAVFFMLPRPHILQPTSRRTFVQGLRSIEGIQEFFLVVSRPANMEGICVEARLDTGHFPENAEIKEPQVKYKESHIDFVVDKFANKAKLFTPAETKSLNTVFTVPEGWHIDRRTSPSPFPKGDLGHVGITATDIGSSTEGAPFDYNYQAINDTQIQISGYIKGGNIAQYHAVFKKKYRVYLKSIEPILSEAGETTDIGDMFITSRSLCCCFYKGEGECLVNEALTPPPFPPGELGLLSMIVEQRKLSIPSSVLDEPIAGISLEPAVKTLLQQWKSIMISTRDGRKSHFEEGISFLETDYFIGKILPHIPDTVLDILLSSIQQLNPVVISAYGQGGTVRDALSDTLSSFIIKTGLDYQQAVSQRNLILSQAY